MDRKLKQLCCKLKLILDLIRIRITCIFIIFEAKWNGEKKQVMGFKGKWQWEMTLQVFDKFSVRSGIASFLKTNKGTYAQNKLKLE